MSRLSWQELSVWYPNQTQTALDKVSLEFDATSCSAIAGASGAGKTTMLLAAAGILGSLQPAKIAGCVRYDDADLGHYRVQTIAEYLGLVQQDPSSQIVGRTVAEDVAFGPRNRLKPRAEIFSLVKESLSAVGLAGFESRLTSSLSGGEQQRLAIAATLAAKPGTLLLDEVSAQIDPAGAAQLNRVLDGLADQGMGTVFTSHNMAEILARAKDLAVLDAGQLVWRGAPEKLARDLKALANWQLRPLAMTSFAAQLLAQLPKDFAGDYELPITEAQLQQLLTDLVQRRAALGGEFLPVEKSVTGNQLGEPIIVFEGLDAGYAPNQPVLKSLDLTINAGEFVALIGVNGAGKTTLVKQLNGLLRPTAGKYWLAGQDSADLASWQLASKVAYVHQNPDQQLFCTTVRKEVGYALAAQELSATEVKNRVDQALADTGLSADAELNPIALPSAKRALVALATALARKTQVIIADEPTAGLDACQAAQVMDLLSKAHKSGATVVMISHDLDLVSQYATRVIELADGGIVADDSPAAVLQTPEIRVWQGVFGHRPDTANPAQLANMAARYIAGGQYGR